MKSRATNLVLYQHSLLLLYLTTFLGLPQHYSLKIHVLFLKNLRFIHVTFEKICQHIFRMLVRCVDELMSLRGDKIAYII